jgi:hypothetical protein
LRPVFLLTAFGRTPEAEHFSGHEKKKSPMDCGSEWKKLKHEEIKLKPGMPGTEIATR